jgi:hypothetical protein
VERRHPRRRRGRLFHPAHRSVDKQQPALSGAPYRRWGRRWWLSSVVGSVPRYEQHPHFVPADRDDRSLLGGATATVSVLGASRRNARCAWRGRFVVLTVSVPLTPGKRRLLFLVRGLRIRCHWHHAVRVHLQDGLGPRYMNGVVIVTQQSTLPRVDETALLPANHAASQPRRFSATAPQTSERSFRRPRSSALKS